MPKQEVNFSSIELPWEGIPIPEEELVAAVKKEVYKMDHAIDEADRMGGRVGRQLQLVKGNAHPYDAYVKQLAVLELFRLHGLEDAYYAGTMDNIATYTEDAKGWQVTLNPAGLKGKFVLKFTEKNIHGLSQQTLHYNTGI